MVAQCPHKALAPSQDQHASTSASSPGTGPYLCPPEEEGERSGSSPLEGSSSSPEEPQTHRGLRAYRWKKSWKQPVEVNLSLLNPTLMSPFSQGYLNPPLIYLTPVKKNMGGLNFFTDFFILFFIFLTSVAMATINGVQTCVNVCDWLAVIWCSYGNHRWNGDCRRWLFFLFQSVQLKGETAWFDFCLLFFPHRWTYMVAILNTLSTAI